MSPQRKYFEKVLPRIIQGKSGAPVNAISPDTLRLHNQLVDRYRTLLDHHKGIIFRPLPPEAVYMIRYLRDAVRTILMMRAMSRLIEVQKQSHEGSIRVVEAGCGLGFLAVVAALLDRRVEVFAFEHIQKLVDLTRKNVRLLGLSDRIQVEKRDLLRQPFREGADLVIAEHLSRGLLQEHAAKLPRSIRNVDPRWFIPYSVRPTVINGIRILQMVQPFQDTDGGDRLGIVLQPPSDPSQVQMCYGEEVVLADPHVADEFHVHAPMTLVPGVNPVMVANDIRWIAPEFDPKNEFVDGFRPEDSIESLQLENRHLLGPAVLTLEDQNDYFHCFFNSGNEPVSATIEVRYPFGLELLGGDPQISCEHPEVQVGTADIVPRVM